MKTSFLLADDKYFYVHLWHKPGREDKWVKYDFYKGHLKHNELVYHHDNIILKVAKFKQLATIRNS